MTNVLCNVGGHLKIYGVTRFLLTQGLKYS